MIVRSKVNGKTLDIAYGHGTNPKFKVNDPVKAGQQILSLGAIGCQVSGGHLHVDMSLEGKHICPQDVFLAIGDNKNPDWEALTNKGVSPCSRP